jgi:hypothetical protein
MRTLFFSILSIAIFCQSCTVCEDDIKLGQAELSDSGKNYLALEGTETLVYKNDKGQTVEYTAPQKRDRNWINVSIEHLGGREGLCQQWSYVDGAQEKITFVNKVDSTQLIFDLHVGALNSLQTSDYKQKLFDEMRIEIQPTFLSSHYITNPRNSTVNRTVADNIIADTTINKVNYKNLEKISSFASSALFSTEKGFVAFTDKKGVLWTLDKIK